MWQHLHVARLGPRGMSRCVSWYIYLAGSAVYAMIQLVKRAPPDNCRKLRTLKRYSQMFSGFHEELVVRVAHVLPI
jgi:hypothetical protein